MQGYSFYVGYEDIGATPRFVVYPVAWRFPPGWSVMATSLVG